MNGISLGRKATIGVLVLLSVLCAGVGLSVVLGWTGNATSSQVKGNQDRQDCKTVVAAQRGAILDERDRVQFEGLLASVSGDSTGVARATAEAVPIEAALKATPRTDQIVADGWTLPPVVRQVVPDLPARIDACPS